MNKVICDVCGTDYPETEPRCPICDCVRTDGGQTAAGNTGEYTYVKGGRFSKSNVRKRLKANQVAQEAPPAAQIPPLFEEETKPPVREEEPDEEFDEDELDSVSNRGLIMIVILLLVAIIAVSSYLAVVIFRNVRRDSDQSTDSTTTAALNGDAEDEKPGDVIPPASNRPCTGLTYLSQDPLILSTAGQTGGAKLFICAEPADTTDPYEFTSKDPTVAIVDKNGLVKGLSRGETVITVKCGEHTAELVVKCTFATPPVVNPDNPDVQKPVLAIRNNWEDISLDSVLPTINLYDGDIPRDQITWTSSKEDVATVEDGEVTPVSLGWTVITATYKDQSVSCIVRVTQAALDKLGIKPVDPDVPDEPDEPDVPDEPDTPDVPDTPDPPAPKTYSLGVNGNYNYRWKIDDKENTADVSLVLNGTAAESSCRLTVQDNEGNTVDVDWTLNKTGIVEYNTETGKYEARKKGNVKLTATIDGTEFEVIFRVSEKTET